MTKDMFSKMAVAPALAAAPAPGTAPQPQEGGGSISQHESDTARLAELSNVTPLLPHLRCQCLYLDAAEDCETEDCETMRTHA